MISVSVRPPAAAAVRSNAASASANVARASGYASASAWPIPTACAPCPGKMKAIIVLIRDLCHPRHVPLDTRDEIARGKPVRHRDRIANGLGGGSSVTNDRQSGNPEQRGTAKFRIVHPALESAECPPRQQVADLARKGSLQLVAEQGRNR